MVIENKFYMKRMALLTGKGHVGTFWFAGNVLYLVHRSILGRVRHVWPGQVGLVV